MQPPTALFKSIAEPSTFSLRPVIGSEPFPSFGNGGQNDYQGLNACLIMKTERVRSLKLRDLSTTSKDLGSFWWVPGRIIVPYIIPVQPDLPRNTAGNDHRQNASLMLERCPLEPLLSLVFPRGVRHKNIQSGAKVVPDYICCITM